MVNKRSYDPHDHLPSTFNTHHYSNTVLENHFQSNCLDRKVPVAKCFLFSRIKTIFSKVIIFKDILEQSMMTAHDKVDTLGKVTKMRSVNNL